MATEKTETQGESLSKLAENERMLAKYMADSRNISMNIHPLKMFAKTKLELLHKIHEAAIREDSGIEEAKAALDLELQKNERDAKLDGLVKDIDSLQQAFRETEIALRDNRDPTLVDGLQNKLRNTNANIASMRKIYDTAIQEIRATAGATAGAAPTSGAAARATSGAAGRGGRRKYTTRIRRRGKKYRSKKYRSKKYKHRHV